MKRDVHDEHRLLARYRSTTAVQGTTSANANSATSNVSYSSHSQMADPDDREAIGRFPTFCLDGTIPGTQPEAALMHAQPEEELTVNRKSKHRRVLPPSPFEDPEEALLRKAANEGWTET